MQFLVEAPPKTKRFIESLLPNMLAQLKLTRSRRLLQIIVDPDLEDLGTTVPLTGVDTFLVVLRPNRDLVSLAVTLAHELCHVSQFARGLLKVTPRGRRWCGKFYSNRVAYLDQPWEIQAFARQELIMRRAIEQ